MNKPRAGRICKSNHDADSGRNLRMKVLQAGPGDTLKHNCQ